jgi:alpha-L-fucosidase
VIRRAAFVLALAAGCAGPAAEDSASCPEPIDPTPTYAQFEWQDLRYCAFVHFGMNTFTNREWGEGNEDPSTFAPDSLDCRQWVAVFKDAGMRGVILTAKHHDGFCLWPSKFSPHTIAQSSWRGGKGDVVRELSDACREAGLKFGVYLSPWDRAHPDYGDSPRYNAAYRGMLEELLTSYGPIFEVWWDGACGEGPNGKKQEYDFDGWTDLVRKLQPNAVIFSDVGPDVRWVGNENGFAGETCWGMISPAGYGRGATGPPQKMLNEGLENGTQWIPAECDVSIRPGWFWHVEEDAKVKSIDELEAIWLASVGRNASLLLNVPANRHGLVSEADAARLREFRSWRESAYAQANDLAGAATATASSVHQGSRMFCAERVLDQALAWGTCGLDDFSGHFWAADETDPAPWIELELPSTERIGQVLLDEPIRFGQRVKSFVVEARVGEDWKEIGRGTTIGHERIVRTEAVDTDAVRVRILEWRAPPCLSRVGLFGAP